MVKKFQKRLDGTFMAAIALQLGMHLGIAVDLAGAGKQQTRPHTPGQTEHVVGAEETGLRCFDRIELVMDRRSRTGHVPDPIRLKLDRLGHVVTDQLEAGMADPAGDVALPAREVVVETDHLLTRIHQPIDQVGAQKSRATGDEVNQHLSPPAADARSRPCR